MQLPITWYNIPATTANQARLLPPRNLRVSLTTGFAQTTPPDVTTAPILTKVEWNANTNLITCDNDPYSVSVPNCTAVDAAYDQSNRLNVAWLANGNVYLNWFDTNSGTWTVTNFGAAVSLALIMSDTRTYSLGVSTIVLFYARAGVVYYRAQADRFQIEYTGLPIPIGAELINVGISENLRLQITLSGLYFQAGMESIGWQAPAPTTEIQAPRNDVTNFHYRRALRYSDSVVCRGTFNPAIDTVTIVDDADIELYALGIVNLKRFDFTFDVNDNPCIVWETTSSELYIHSYDDVWDGMVTRSLGYGQRPCCSIDDINPININNAGIILFYQIGSSIYSRHQSDRYGFAYIVPNTTLGEFQRLSTCGFNSNGKLILRIES